MKLLPAALALALLPGLARSGDDFDISIRSTIRIDTHTVTVPLFRGWHNGQPVWYIVTDSSDRGEASARGVNFAPKLANALGTAAVQTVSWNGAEPVFRGTVDFSPARNVAPGPEGFPPAAAAPGSTGDAMYSPLITPGNGVVLNAPHVANATGMHDRIVAIDFDARTVTLELTEGIYNDKKVLYISTESSAPDVAAIEAATFAPNLNAAPGLASDDFDTSARTAIVPVVNGPTGAGNPDRQGLQSALLGEGSPRNVIQHAPHDSGGSRYTPLWDVHPLVWTDLARRELVGSFSEIGGAVEHGFAASAGMGPQNDKLGGLRAAGFIVNCPVFAVE